MKKEYKSLEITIYHFDDADVIRLSNVDGDETLYPIPDGWAE